MYELLTHFTAEESEMQTRYGAALTHRMVLVIPLPLPNPHQSPNLWLQSQNPLHSINLRLLCFDYSHSWQFGTFLLLLFSEEFEVKHLRVWTTGSYLSPLRIKVSSFILLVSLSSRKSNLFKASFLSKDVVFWLLLADSTPVPSQIILIPKQIKVGFVCGAESWVRRNPVSALC